MDPTFMFCPNEDCPLRGKVGGGNVQIHSQKEKRYCCSRCHKTFSQRRGTAYFRLHKEEELFTVVVTLLSHGCPPQAIVAAFGLDERTVKRWLLRGGKQAEAVQAHLIEQGNLDLKHVQADELYVNMVSPPKQKEDPTASNATGENSTTNNVTGENSANAARGSGQPSGREDYKEAGSEEARSEEAGSEEAGSVSEGKRKRTAAWMAMSMAVPCRLWLGGAISMTRDRALINEVTQKVSRCSLPLQQCSALVVCVDGLSTYIKAFLKAFRIPPGCYVHSESDTPAATIGSDPANRENATGGHGMGSYGVGENATGEAEQASVQPRRKMKVKFKLFMGQVVKQFSGRKLTSVERRVVQGEGKAIQRVLEETKTGTQINTSYIERLNGIFRSRLAPLVRRGRAMAHTDTLLHAGMYLVGVSYNFCCPHRTLTQLATLASSEAPKLEGRPSGKQPTTPAMAAGVADHMWSMRELMSYAVPPPPCEPPKRRRSRYKLKRDIPDEAPDPLTERAQQARFSCHRTATPSLCADHG